MKLHQLVKEWLYEFKSDNDNYSGFYIKYFGNKTFYTKLSNAIETNSEIEAICHQIYKFAHSKNTKLNIMLLDFLPVILETYLILLFSSNKNIRESNNTLLLIRTCFLSVYNLIKSKNTDDDEKLSKPLFFIPTFTDGSIFHSQVGRPDLDFLNHSLTVSQPSGLITSDKQLIPGLIQLYTRFICQFSDVSLADFCSLASRMAALNTEPRVDVSCETLNELLVGIYFILFKQTPLSSVVASRALKSIETRANYEMMTRVMLAVNAIQNSFLAASTPELPDGPIGLKTFTKPRSETLISENVITNANFRPEKVAEDLEHLLDVNQNNPAAVVDPADVTVSFKGATVPVVSINSKTSKIKFSAKLDKSMQNTENRLYESETN